MSTSTVPKEKKSKFLTPQERTTIQTLHKKGVQKPQIAKLLSCSLKSVDRWVKRESVENEIGQGAPKKYSSKVQRQIVRAVKRRPKKGVRKVLEKINKKRNVNVPYRTAVRYVHQESGRWGKAKTGNILSVIEKKKRYRWAKKYVTQESWNGLWFHDESYYSLDSQNFCQWNFPDTPLQKTQKHFRHLKFEAFISREGKSELFFFEGRRTSTHFRKHLLQYLPDLKRRTRSQKFNRLEVIFDRASSHTSKFSKEFLKSENIKYRFFCPRPCEINVIERVWGIVKNAVRAKDPKNYLKQKFFFSLNGIKFRAIF